MRDPFASPTSLRLKPVDIAGMSGPVDLRPLGSREEESAHDGPAVMAFLTVGRAADNHLALVGDRFPSVSSHHLRFEQRADGLYVVDLDSKNGVLVGGDPIDGERLLQKGDQVRLGTVGPKFLVVGGRSLEETVFVNKETLRKGGAKDVEQMVKKGNRRTSRQLAVLCAVLAAAIGWLIFDNAQRREQQKTRDLAYEDELRDATEQIEALRLGVAEREEERVLSEEERTREIERLEASLASRTETLTASLEAGSEREQSLVKRIAELELTGASREVMERLERDLAAARGDLDKTREDLALARRRVDLFDPVTVNQSRVTGVGRVRRSVVLIENRVTIENLVTGTRLHLEESEDGERVRPNFEGIGEEFTLESTGSGFCVDRDGWILTNAHVIAAPDSEALRSLSKAPIFEQQIELNVVFSGEKTRHRARVHAVGSGGVDLALLKIEPFEGMPTLDVFDTKTPPPPAGSDIFLFGFPLGHLAVQEGETVIASTFRGILSRNVGGQMQVDAGVHPGNSGGPITDASGRVIGVVVSVQALPDRTAVYTIGYGIPIGDAAELWPPADSAPDPPGAAEEPDGSLPSSK